MRILVTGATGFTGRYFTAYASAQGHSVTSLTSSLTDAATLANEIAAIQPEAVVHLAAISFVGHANESAQYAVNVVGTTHLLQALSMLPKAPCKVLLASSANVYGNCPTSPIEETQALAPVNHYAMSKMAMEYMARQYMDKLPIVISRPFNYTGPGQAGNFLIPKLVNKFIEKAPSVELGNMHVLREFNDVRMVCNAYLALLEAGVPGEVYNICTGDMHSVNDVMTTLTELTGHQMTVTVNPAFVRANEVNQLCGSPHKLDLLCKNLGRPLQRTSLKELLRWMLEPGSEQTSMLAAH